MSKDVELLNKFDSYDVARLIPTLPEGKREERATSILLAVFRAVPAFATDLLRDAGGPTAKSSRIHCYTEVCPKKQASNRKLRPDGVVVVDTGRSTWSAIIETKVGLNSLDANQIESYVGLARDLGCDAVITISNQFSAVPTHHPIAFPKNKLGKMGLFHFSWLSLVSKAVLLAEHKQVDDPEQAFLLDELIRYLQNPKSGVSLMTQVGPGWKRSCDQTLKGVRLLKSSEEVEQAVASWQQLSRFLALQLTIKIAKPVSVKLTRPQIKDPSVRVKSQIEQLVDKNCLRDSLQVTNAVSDIDIAADFQRRAIDFSVQVQSPKDKKFATASVNWLLRQLGDADSSLMIRANWPGRTPSSMRTLAELREDAATIIPENIKALPTSLEVVRVVDLAAKFQQKRKFVEIAEKELIRFYSDAVQHLKNWVAPPPKMKRQSADENETGVSEEIKIPDRGASWARDPYDT